MIDELLEERGITPAVNDGLLLIRVDPQGRVHPHVLRLGLLTEGRLEGALMPIFNEIVKTRTILAHKLMQKDSVR